MSNDAPQKGELVSTASGGLARPEVESLILRGLQDLTVAAQAEQFFSWAVANWNARRYESAVGLFSHCVKCGPHHAAAHFYLGVAYYQGIGVPQKDPAQAANCWRKAAEQGYAQAQNNLAGLCEQAGSGEEYCEAAFWYAKAAEQGYATAQFNLGVLYELGRGVPQDYEQAAVWYRKAAEQGNAAAQFNLGGMFRLGRGVRQNYAHAASWYRKAAEQGHAGAQYNLGAMCTLGHGMRRDFTEAAVWFRRAAGQGDELAQKALESFPAAPKGRST